MTTPKRIYPVRVTPTRNYHGQSFTPPHPPDPPTGELKMDFSSADNSMYIPLIILGQA